MRTKKSANHLHALVDDLQFFDRVTRNVRAKQRSRSFDEKESLRLAAQFSLENSEDFTDFCDSQYPTQGKVLVKALERRAKREIE